MKANKTQTGYEDWTDKELREKLVSMVGVKPFFTKQEIDLKNRPTIIFWIKEKDEVIRKAMTTGKYNIDIKVVG